MSHHARKGRHLEAFLGQLQFRSPGTVKRGYKIVSQSRKRGGQSEVKNLPAKIREVVRQNLRANFREKCNEKSQIWIPGPFLDPSPWTQNSYASAHVHMLAFSSSSLGDG